ncbi:helix-turn-helix domain-containing protein [Bdellovibrionota bacterium]
MAIPLKKQSEVPGYGKDTESFMVQLIELQGELAQEHKLAPLYAKIIEGAISLFGGSRAMVTIWQQGSPQVKATHGIDPTQLDRPPFRRFMQLSDETHRSRKGKLSSLPSGEGVTSLKEEKCLTAPLSDRNGCLGALVIEGHFNTDDLQLFQLFSNQATIAIQNAKAFEDLSTQGGRPVVAASDIPFGETLDHIVAQFEAEVILKVIEKNHGNKTLAAKSLGITRGTLYNKLNAAKVR